MSYDKCHFDECHFDECHFDHCHFDDCYSDKCHFDECHYAESRGTKFSYGSMFWNREDKHIVLFNFATQTFII